MDSGGASWSSAAPDTRIADTKSEPDLQATNHAGEGANQWLAHEKMPFKAPQTAGVETKSTSPRWISNFLISSESKYLIRYISQNNKSTFPLWRLTKFDSLFSRRASCILPANSAEFHTSGPSSRKANAFLTEF